MPTQITRTAYEIRKEIYQLTGKECGPHRRGTPNAEIPYPLDSHVRSLLKEWLISLGVPEGETNKSDKGLVRCYAAGRNWVINRLVNGTSKPNSRPEIDLGGFGQKTAALLDQNDSEETPEPQIDNLDNLVLQTNIEKAKQELKLEFESIKKYLYSKINVEITGGLNAAIQSLDLKSEVEKANEVLWPKLEQKITDIATKAINSAADGALFNALSKKRAQNQENHSEDKIETSEIDLINQISQTDPEIAPYIPAIDPNYHFDPYATKVIQSALALGENVYAYGDTGCGKTTHFEQVCAVLNRGISRINPHDGVTREMFLGGMKLINGETKFIEGALPRAMRLGLVFLVDEISFLPPNLTAILNPIGEKGGKLYIPETGEWISPAPGFCLFATDNTGGKGDRTGQYTGTEVQNTATLDRFAFCLKMDYLPADKEIEMLEKRFPNADMAEIEAIHNLACEIRNAFSRSELSITFSTRKLIKFFQQRAAGFSLKEALDNTLLSWLDEDDAQFVKTTIDRLQINLNSETRSNINTDNSEIGKAKLEFQALVQNNEKVRAIKMLRDPFKGLGLKEAKDLTEDYWRGLKTLDEVFEIAASQIPL